MSPILVANMGLIFGQFFHSATLLLSAGIVTLLDFAVHENLLQHPSNCTRLCIVIMFIILRPYRELMSVEDAYVKTLICERGDR